MNKKRKLNEDLIVHIPEQIVEAIDKDRFSTKTEQKEWRVKWEGVTTRTWEPKSCFVDIDENGEETLNEYYVEYEKKRKNQEKEKKKEKKKQKNQETKTGMKKEKIVPKRANKKVAPFKYIFGDSDEDTNCSSDEIRPKENKNESVIPLKKRQFFPAEGSKILASANIPPSIGTYKLSYHTEIPEYVGVKIEAKAYYHPEITRLSTLADKFEFTFEESIWENLDMTFKEAVVIGLSMAPLMQETNEPQIEKRDPNSTTNALLLPKMVASQILATKPASPDLFIPKNDAKMVINKTYDLIANTNQAQKNNFTFTGLTQSSNNALRQKKLDNKRNITPKVEKPNIKKEISDRIDIIKVSETLLESISHGPSITTKDIANNQFILGQMLMLQINDAHKKESDNVLGCPSVTEAELLPLIAEAIQEDPSLDVKSQARIAMTVSRSRFFIEEQVEFRDWKMIQKEYFYQATAFLAKYKNNSYPYFFLNPIKGACHPFLVNRRDCKEEAQFKELVKLHAAKVYELMMASTSPLFSYFPTSPSPQVSNLIINIIACEESSFEAIQASCLVQRNKLSLKLQALVSAECSSYIKNEYLD